MRRDFRSWDGPAVLLSVSRPAPNVSFGMFKGRRRRAVSAGSAARGEAVVPHRRAGAGAREGSRRYAWSRRGAGRGTGTTARVRPSRGLPSGPRRRRPSERRLERAWGAAGGDILLSGCSCPPYPRPWSSRPGEPGPRRTGCRRVGAARGRRAGAGVGRQEPTLGGGQRVSGGRESAYRRAADEPAGCCELRLVARSGHSDGRKHQPS